MYCVKEQLKSFYISTPSRLCVLCKRDYDPFLYQLPPGCLYCVYDRLQSFSISTLSRLFLLCNRLQSFSVSTPSRLCVLSKWLITILFYSNSLHAIGKRLENYKRFQTSKLIKKMSHSSSLAPIEYKFQIWCSFFFDTAPVYLSDLCVLFIKTTLLLLIWELHIWRSKH